MMDEDFGTMINRRMEEHNIIYCSKGGIKFQGNCDEFVEDNPNILTICGGDKCYNCKNC